MKVDYIGYAIALVTFVIGLLVSYYFYKKSIKIKEPVYSIKSNNVISDSKSKYEHLKVLYSKKEVENFTVSRVLFFNRGSETITREDIETSYPLRVSMKDCELLDAFILQVNKPSNKFTILWDKSGEALSIDFDYLDQNQGGVIQVAHTGLSSDNIMIEGDIMGVQRLVSISPEQLRRGTGTRTGGFGWKIFTVLTMILYLSLLYLLTWSGTLKMAFFDTDFFTP